MKSRGQRIYEKSREGEEPKYFAKKDRERGKIPLQAKQLSLNKSKEDKKKTRTLTSGGSGFNLKEVPFRRPEHENPKNNCGPRAASEICGEDESREKSNLPVGPGRRGQEKSHVPEKEDSAGVLTFTKGSFKLRAIEADNKERREGV